VTGENGTPETPEWVTDSRRCPFVNCWACKPDDGYGTYPLPERFELGEN
jgi:hypothetical protein